MTGWWQAYDTHLDYALLTVPSEEAARRCVDRHNRYEAETNGVQEFYPGGPHTWNGERYVPLPA